MTQEQLQKLAATLNITLEQATSLVETEAKRVAAGKRYRESEAYKRRLEMQKLVRLAMKEVRV